MNFDFSEDERAVKDQARRFLADQNLLPVVRAMLDGGGGETPASLWASAGEMGWPGAAIPEEYGGFGLGHVALCAIAEEIGRACAPLPMFASVYLAAESLLVAGDEAQKQLWLPQLAAGSLIGSAFIDARPAEKLPLEVTNGRITGTLSPVPHGMEAGFVVFTAREGDKSSLFLVTLDQPQIARRKLVTIDDSRPHAAISFTGAAVEPLGKAGEGPALGRQIQARAAVLTGFEQLGGADAAFEMALAYARERRSFGRVIGSYQAIKHKLADMYVKNELARSNAYYSAWALTSGDAGTLELAAATTRVSCTDAFEFSSAENIEIYGGMGFTWAADPHLYYRRSRLLALALGAPDEWSRRLARALAAPHAA